MDSEDHELAPDSSDVRSRPHPNSEPRNSSMIEEEKLRERLRMNIKPLCQRCDKIDFIKFFRVSKWLGEMKAEQTATLGALQASSCPLCRLILQQICNAWLRPGMKPLSGSTEIKYEIRNYPTSSYELLDNNTEGSYRCSIDIY